MAGAIFAPAAQAASFIVDSPADGAPDACSPDPCTLREAITLANANGARPAVVATGS